MPTPPISTVVAAAESALGAYPIRRLWARWLWALPLLVLGSAALVVALAYALVWGAWLALEAAHMLAGLMALVAPLVAALLWWALWCLRCAMLRLQDQAEASHAAAQAQLQRRAQVAALSVRLQQAQSSAELADTLLSALAQLLPVRQALCALWHDTDRTLVAAARYGGAGADAPTVMTRLPRLGTLLHECALQRQLLRIPQPGSAFLRIASGLGDMAPAEIVLYPVQYGGQVFAVLELAALHPLTAEDLALLADIEPVFAMGLDIVQRADRTEQLLDEARAASEHSQLLLAQAQEAAQHQHQLLANISREVRSAMNAVVGLSHVLLHSPLQPGQQRTVHQVLAAGRHLLAVLNGMLDFLPAPSAPWQQPCVADPAQRAQRLQDIAGARVLVVEDDPIDQEVATELLRDAGLAVDVAVNGEQALLQLQQRDYDLVFIDLRMPVLDGLATAERIRQQPRWAQLPLVALTANVLPEDVQHCHDAGMNDHLAKPIEPDLLLDKLLQWVQPHTTEGGAPCN